MHTNVVIIATCLQLTSNWNQQPNDVCSYNIWISCYNVCSGNTHTPQAILSWAALTFKNTTTIATRIWARCLCTLKSCILPQHDSSCIKTKGRCKRQNKGTVQTQLNCNIGNCNTIELQQIAIGNCNTIEIAA